MAFVEPKNEVVGGLKKWSMIIGYGIGKGFAAGMKKKKSKKW